MCPTIKILISNWPRTWKFSQLLQAGKTVAFDFSHHVHALVTLYVQFLCSDWSKFDSWVHEENLCSILNLVYFWQLKPTGPLFVSTFDVFNCLFPMDIQNEIQLLWGVFCYSWFVYWVFGWEIRRLSKSEIWFMMASFSFSPCLMRKRIAESEAILALLDTFQELHLEVCRYDKNSASCFCFTSDVMYKWYKRLVYTHPDLSTRFCKVNLSNAKKLAWFFFLLINLRWSENHYGS